MLGSISEKNSRIFNLSCFAYQVLIALWIIGEIFIVGELLATGTFFFSAQGNSQTYGDFLSFYKCGKIVCSQTPKLLYDVPTQIIWFNKLIAPAVSNSLVYSEYTPPFCLAMGVLSLCPIFWSYLIWMLATVALGCYALWCLFDAVGYLNKKERILFLLAVFSSSPSWMALRNGQSSWLLLGMGAFFIHCFLSKRDILAGFCLSIIATKPQYSLFLVLPALAGKRYKTIGSAVLCSVFQYLVAALIVGWDTILHYPQAIMFAQDQNNQIDAPFGPGRLACLRVFLTLFTTPSFNYHLSFILMITFLVLLFFLWCRVYNCPKAIVYSCFSLTVLLALFLSPHVILDDCLFLAIPAALTLKTLNPLAITTDCRDSERLFS